MKRLFVWFPLFIMLLFSSCYLKLEMPTPSAPSKPAPPATAAHTATPAPVISDYPENPAAFQSDGSVHTVPNKLFSVAIPRSFDCTEHVSDTMTCIAAQKLYTEDCTHVYVYALSGEKKMSWKQIRQLISKRGLKIDTRLRDKTVKVNGIPWHCLEYTFTDEEVKYRTVHVSYFVYETEAYTYWIEMMCLEVEYDFYKEPYDTVIQTFSPQES